MSITRSSQISNYSATIFAYNLLNMNKFKLSFKAYYSYIMNQRNETSLIIKNNILQ